VRTKYLAVYKDGDIGLVLRYKRGFSDEVALHLGEELGDFMCYMMSKPGPLGDESC